MEKSVDRKGNKANKKFRWLPELDRLLIVGIKSGPAAKRDAINKVLKLVPELTRGDCWRRGAAFAQEVRDLDSSRGRSIRDVKETEENRSRSTVSRSAVDDSR